jgi:hypothetical protein
MERDRLATYYLARMVEHLLSTDIASRSERRDFA